MGKTHVPHRVVIRDASDRIISDTEHEDFAAGKVAYDNTPAPEGCVVTLQHGARVIFRR